MDKPFPQREELDWEYQRECPRCGDEAAWDGGTETWDGRNCLTLACPGCGYRFAHYSGKWEIAFRKEGMPAFTPGRGACASDEL